jgi:hypothetical protein
MILAADGEALVAGLHQEQGGEVFAQRRDGSTGSGGTQQGKRGRKTAARISAPAYGAARTRWHR